MAHRTRRLQDSGIIAMTRYVEVQHILGRRVLDSEGRVAGRIEAIRAETVGQKCIVLEYQLGTAAFLSRLGIVAGRLLGVGRTSLLRVPWDRLDLSEPDQPRLRESVGELELLQATLPPFRDESPPRREPAGD